MPRISVRRIEWAAAGLALLIAGVHLSVGITGLWEYHRVGSIPDIRTPVFLFVALLLTAGVVAVATGRLRRDHAYSIGAVLMVVHLLAYLDWHLLHVLERLVDFGELGHGHAHGTIDGDFREAVLAMLADWWNFHDHGAAVSVVLAALNHATESPLELVSKSSELLLLFFLIVLRWAHRIDASTVEWEPREQDVTLGMAAGVAGVGIWGGVVAIRGILVDGGADPLFVHFIELTAFGLLLLWVWWFFVGRPVVVAAGQGENPSLLSALPGFESTISVQNVGVGVVYVVAFLAISTTIVGFVPPADDHSHAHGDDPDLERLMDTLEDRGIDVDREWSMVHYSEYHGGDALLFDYHTPYQGDRAATESEIEKIVDAYVDAVAAGDFDQIVVFLAEARASADEPYVRWEIDQTWVTEYLAGDRTRDELLGAVLDTYDLRI